MSKKKDDPVRCHVVPSDVNMKMADDGKEYQCVRREGHEHTGIEGCTFGPKDQWDPEEFPQMTSDPDPV